MKELELKLISELMKNGRKSDRELAKAIGVSQPTVSRIRSRLEKKGVIKEYTMIPDFSKLGFKILAITFALSRPLDKEESKKVMKAFAENIRERHFEFIMLERGQGLGFDGVIISLHKDYNSYLKLLEWLKQLKFLKVDKSDSFLINLEEVRYRPLTFSTIANILLPTEEKGKKHE